MRKNCRRALVSSVVQGKVRGLVDHDADDAVHEIADVIAFTVVKGEAGQQAPTSKPHTTYPWLSRRG